ncbi:MAG: hypothetical protein EBZ67_14565 [Chitinophagia bacterium]|nr:hypothetical protein [Chitinophagia bacterium]
MNSSEETLYEIVGREIHAGSVRMGLWTKAFATVHGDVQEAKALYVEMRVEQLREEIRLQSAERAHARCMRDREDDLTILSEWTDLRSIPWKDMDHVSRELFSGNPDTLSRPATCERVAQVLEMPEFQVIDLVKRGYLIGVLHEGRWYCDLWKKPMSALKACKRCGYDMDVTLGQSTCGECGAPLD